MRVLRTLALLSQFGGIGFRVFNQIRVVDVGLKGFHIDGLQLTLCDGLWYSVTVVCRYFQISNNRKTVDHYVNPHLESHLIELSGIWLAIPPNKLFVFHQRPQNEIIARFEEMNKFPYDPLFNL